MKAETKLKKIMALPDGELKKLKLIGFCFSVVPSSPIQFKAKEELKKLGKII